MLAPKIDYYGLAGSGFVAESTSEGKTAGYQAEARGDDGFLVAIDVGPDRQAPTVNYVATSDVNISNVKIGGVHTIGSGADQHTVALGSVTITTSAGEPVRMTATGSEIEKDGAAHCTATLTGISLSSLFHAQTFGLFTVSKGQLTDSTLTIEGNIGTADVDGITKASDLVGAAIRVSGTIVGVDDTGKIETPTIQLNTPTGNVLPGVITQPLSQTNPNGDFPTYEFEITWGMKADVTSA